MLRECIRPSVRPNHSGSSTTHYLSPVPDLGPVKKPSNHLRRQQDVTMLLRMFLRLYLCLIRPRMRKP